jgi:hypothetical protein
LISTYLSLEAVNRITPVKKLAIYFKVGIVGAVLLGARYKKYKLFSNQNWIWNILYKKYIKLNWIIT